MRKRTTDLHVALNIFGNPIMTDICVIYDSKDKKVASRLVELLSNQWNVWWAEDDIPQGDWEHQVREQISQAKAVVPVLSFYTENNDILKDEL
jgi:sensor domain CHASE-containing protein